MSFVLLHPNHSNSSFLHMLETFEKALPAVRQGDVMLVEVVSVGNDAVEVQSDAIKSTARLPKTEFLDESGVCEVSVGDTASVIVDQLDDGFGQVILSRQKAKAFLAWSELEQASKTQTLIRCYVTQAIKGGFQVAYRSLNLFLPHSLSDLSVHEAMPDLVGQWIEVQVMKLQNSTRNVVVSRKAALEKARGIDKKTILSQFQIGQTLEGRIKSLMPYGAFVDLGVIDGLIHLKDFGQRIDHPSQVVSAQQVVQVEVIHIDMDKQRIQLKLLPSKI